MKTTREKGIKPRGKEGEKSKSGKKDLVRE